MKSFINQNRRFANLALTAVAVCLGLGVIQVQAQSVTYTFADSTSDGWATAGFSGARSLQFQTIGGQNYIYVPFGSGFQSANDASDSAGNLAGFNAAMSAAILNPSGYDISYNYYINTADYFRRDFPAAWHVCQYGQRLLCPGL